MMSWSPAARGAELGRQVDPLTGDTLTLESSNSLPDGSMTPVRTATYVKYTPVAMPAPPSRTVESGYVGLSTARTGPGRKASANPDSFKVENGAVVANAAGQASHLVYDGPVGNHSFQNSDPRLDVLARDRSRWRYVMTEFQPRGFQGKGFEIQVNNSHSDRSSYVQPLPVVDLSNVPGKDATSGSAMEIEGEANTITISLKGQEVVRLHEPADWQSNYDTASRKIAPDDRVSVTDLQQRTVTRTSGSSC